MAATTRLVVYTALFGAHAKPLAEPLVPFDTPLVCFTDRRDLRSERWLIKLVEPQACPHRANRAFKLLSHQCLNTLWSLYIDSNIQLKVDPATLLHHGPFVTSRHRARTNIVEEAAAIIRLGKAPRDLVWRQVRAYQAEGFATEDNPQRTLGENTILLRRHNTRVNLLNELWHEEIQKYTHRDQLSLDYVAWKSEFKLNYWPGTTHKSPYFQIAGPPVVRRQRTLTKGYYDKLNRK